MKKFTGLFSIFAFIFFFFASLADAQLNFYFVNVGQGDATYIELPNGKNALIDGGPTNRLINDFLNSKNVTHIDHVVLTHPHSDHYIGLKKVFKTRTVSNFYDSRVENIAAKGDNTLREQANAQRACKTHFPKIGEKLNWDPSVDVKVLNTCETPFETRNNSKLNNCSIVLKITYNGTTVMMMGDAEMPAEAEILKRFPNELKSYALKAGHHGSDTASLMLENAVYSVISPEGCAGILWRDGATFKMIARISPDEFKALSPLMAGAMTLGSAMHAVPSAGDDEEDK